MRVRARAIPSIGEDDVDVDALWKERRERCLELGAKVVASTFSESWRTPRAEVEEEVGGKERRAEEGMRVREGDQ